jgi:hypothetical protein
MRTRVRGSPVSERAADENCFLALLPRRRRGLALKNVIKSPEVNVGGLILSHESRAPSICTALCTARKICEHCILGRERTAVAKMIPTHERNGYVRADLGTGVPIHSTE